MPIGGNLPGAGANNTGGFGGGAVGGNHGGGGLTGGATNTKNGSGTLGGGNGASAILQQGIFRNTLTNAAARVPTLLFDAFGHPSPLAPLATATGTAWTYQKLMGGRILLGS